MKIIMTVCFWLGLLFVFSGVCFAFFADLTVSMGGNGIVVVSLIIGLGLLLVIPSKIYLLVVFLQEKESQPHHSNTHDE